VLNVYAFTFRIVEVEFELMGKDEETEMINYTCLGTYSTVGPMRNKAKGRGMVGIP
jgi:hypothetical protein